MVKLASWHLLFIVLEAVLDIRLILITVSSERSREEDTLPEPKTSQKAVT